MSSTEARTANRSGGQLLKSTLTLHPNPTPNSIFILTLNLNVILNLTQTQTLTPDRNPSNGCRLTTRCWRRRTTCCGLSASVA